MSINSDSSSLGWSCGRSMNMAWAHSHLGEILTYYPIFKFTQFLWLTIRRGLGVKDLASTWHQENSVGSRSAFCFAWETWVILNWFDLFRSHMLRSCQFQVGVPYFAQVSKTFLFTQLQISKALAGRMVSTVSKHKRKPEWMCFSEKVNQALVVSFTTN